MDLTVIRFSDFFTYLNILYKIEGNSNRAIRIWILNSGLCWSRVRIRGISFVSGSHRRSLGSSHSWQWDRWIFCWAHNGRKVYMWSSGSWYLVF